MANSSAVSVSDRLDDLKFKSAKLKALLRSVSGCGFENFREMDEGDQDSLLWLAADLAEEINGLAISMSMGSAVVHAHPSTPRAARAQGERQ